MVTPTKWWSTNVAKEPFWGVAIDRWRDADQRSQKVSSGLIVADCTHRVFIAPEYSGTDDYLLSCLPGSGDSRSGYVLLIWVRATRGVSGGLDLSYKQIISGTDFHESDLNLAMTIETVVDLLQTRRSKYFPDGFDWGMPTFSSFVGQLLYLEERCQQEFSEL